MGKQVNKYKVWWTTSTESIRLFNDYNEAKQYFYMLCEVGEEVTLLKLYGYEYKTLKYHINYYYNQEGDRI